MSNMKKKILAGLRRGLKVNIEDVYEARKYSQDAGPSSTVPSLPLVDSPVTKVFSATCFTPLSNSHYVKTGIDISQGGMLWSKTRNTAGGHMIQDTERGLDKALYTNNTAAQTSTPHGSTVLNSDGVTFNGMSFNARVVYSFAKKAKFFDIVKYTGDGVAGRQLNHALGIAPGMILIRAVNTTGNWRVLHRGNDGSAPWQIDLNSTVRGYTTVKKLDAATFTPDDVSNSLNAAGIEYVAYLFAHDESYDSMIQCGMYVGNSGIMRINIGWRPQFILIREASGVANWTIYDTSRAVNTSRQRPIYANTDAVEALGDQGIVANAQGFTLGNASSQGSFNQISTPYIWMAIRAPEASSMSGGMTIFKNRANGTAWSVIDTVRGVQSALPLNTNSAHLNYADAFSEFGAQGMSVGMAAPTGSTAAANFMSWTFKRSPRFFNIVTWTGDGKADQAIPHGMTADIGMVWVKAIDSAGDWVAAHRFNKNDTHMIINGRLVADKAPAAPGRIGWDNKNIYVHQFDDTTSYFSRYQENKAGWRYVAYIFAHDESPDGLIQCGVYQGNGSANGPVVNLGWEPQTLLVKGINTATGWVIMDAVRDFGVSYADDKSLVFDTTGAEGAYSTLATPLANGFKIDTNLDSFNTLNQTYAYMAIRRPMKQSKSGYDMFMPVTRNGTSSVFTITDAKFEPDMAMVLTNNTATDVMVVDKSRGASKALWTNLTQGESTANITFENNGIGLTAAYPNNGYNFTYLLFKRMRGAFDVVTWIGTGGNGLETYPHSLGVKPELTITKSRIRNTNWQVVHTGGKALLNSNANSAGPSALQSYTTDKTFTPFSISVDELPNMATYTYVSYMFATLPGVTKVFTYTGTGAAQVIDCGFTNGARFVMIKRIDVAGNWYVWDTSRGIGIGNDPRISLNTAAVQVLDDSLYADPSGFGVNQITATQLSVAGSTYIGLAIA